MKVHLLKPCLAQFTFTGTGKDKNTLFCTIHNHISFAQYDESEKSLQWPQEFQSIFLPKHESNYFLWIKFGDKSIVAGKDDGNSTAAAATEPQQYISVCGPLIQGLNLTCRDLRVKVKLQESVDPYPTIVETNAMPVAPGKCVDYGTTHYAEQFVILPISWCKSRRGHIFDAWSEKFNLRISVEIFAESLYMETHTHPIRTTSGEAVRFCITKKILAEEIDADSILVASCGTELKCHKCFLSAQSPVLARMFQSDFKESKTCRIEMVDMSVQGIKAFLEYVYNWETSLAEEQPRIALELLEAGHKYNMTALEEEMKALFLRKPNDIYDVDFALKLFLLARNVEGYGDLKMKAVQALKSKFKELQASEEYQNLFRKDVDAAMDLCASFALV